MRRCQSTVSTPGGAGAWPCKPAEQRHVHPAGAVDPQPVRAAVEVDVRAGQPQPAALETRRPAGDRHGGAGRRHVGRIQPIAADPQRPLAGLGGLRFHEIDAVFDRQVGDGGLLLAQQHPGTEQSADDLEPLQGRRLGWRLNVLLGWQLNCHPGAELPARCNGGEPPSRRALSPTAASGRRSDGRYVPRSPFPFPSPQTTPPTAAPCRRAGASSCGRRCGPTCGWAAIGMAGSLPPVASPRARGVSLAPGVGQLPGSSTPRRRSRRSIALVCPARPAVGPSRWPPTAGRADRATGRGASRALGRPRGPNGPARPTGSRGCGRGFRWDPAARRLPGRRPSVMEPACRSYWSRWPRAVTTPPCSFWLGAVTTTGLPCASIRCGHQVQRAGGLRIGLLFRPLREVQREKRRR